MMSYRPSFSKNLRTIVNATIYNYSTAKNVKPKAKNETYPKKQEGKPAGWDEAEPFDKIPGPKPLPLLGNSWRFAIGALKGENFGNMFGLWRESYGDVVSARKMLGGENYVFFFKPEDVEMIFRNEGKWPIRETLPIMEHYRKELRKDVFGDVTGLTTEQGEKWQYFRTIVNPILMQPRVTVQYVKNMDVVAQEFIERIRQLAAAHPQNQMPEDFGNELNKWALESIALIAMDKRLGCLESVPNPEAQTIIKLVLELFDLLFKLEFGPSLWRYYKTKTYKRFVEVQDLVVSYFLKWLDEASENIQKSVGDKPVHEQSALEKLLKIDKKVALIMAMDMMGAGIDTTSKTTGATLYFLAKNPKVQEKLRGELETLLPTKNSPVTTEVLDEAQYLKAAIKESMRIAPIGSGNLRKAREDVVIGGYQIPKGTQLFAANLYMSMNYFPRGEEFIPERWLRSTTGELTHKNLSPFTTLPFGFGPRSCVGKRLANLEIENLVAKVIRNFKLEWHHDEMKFKQGVIYGFADPLRLTISENKS